MNDLVLPRRNFVFGLAGLFAAPAIIKAENLMALSPQNWPGSAKDDGKPQTPKKSSVLIMTQS